MMSILMQIKNLQDEQKKTQDEFYSKIQALDDSMVFRENLRKIQASIQEGEFTIYIENIGALSGIKIIEFFDYVDRLKTEYFLYRKELSESQT